MWLGTLHYTTLPYQIGDGSGVVCVLFIFLSSTHGAQAFVLMYFGERLRKELSGR